MNTHKHYFYIAALTVFSIFIWSSYGFAFGDDKLARDSLRGINNLGIVIDWDSSGMDPEKLKSIKEKLKRNANQRLQQKGIKVYSGNSNVKPPFLCMEIETMKCDKKTHALYMTAKAMQEVVLKNKQSINAISPTWSSGGILGIIAEESIQDVASKLIDEFITAYMSVNPKNDTDKGI